MKRKLKMRLFFPKWEKIPEQTPYDLPPLGVIQVAGCLPEWVDVELFNENVQEIELDGDYDIAGISIMLTAQALRAYEISAYLRARGKTVILGGQHVTMCPEEASNHADAILIGEAEGLIDKIVEDYCEGKLQKIYRQNGFPDISNAPAPRRDLHDKAGLYTVRGWEMMDLIQTSRGCKFNCYPCSVTYLEGAKLRTKRIERVLQDVQRCSRRIFIVDNSLDQDIEYQKSLISALSGIGKRWVSHPINPIPSMLKLAADAGWWYVYLAIYKMSEKVRDRVKMYHDYGIGVEGTVMLGLDYHTEDFIKKLVDFLLEIKLDLAEFTIVTPFPHSRIYHQMEAEGRIIDRNWNNYNTAKVVFKPKNMTPERLAELYRWAWKYFYSSESQNTKMAKLLVRAKSDTGHKASQSVTKGVT